MPGTTGSSTPLWFRWEDDGFASAPSDSTDKSFGADATADTNEGSNNAVRVLAPDSIEATDIIEQNFSGSFTISFTLADPWWLRAIFGAPTTTGSGPYTHAYDGETPSTMSIYMSDRQSGGERVLRGCLLAEATITTTTPEFVQVELTGAYADEDKTAPGTISGQPDLDYRPLKYSETRLDIAGAKEAYVQDATLTVSLNTNLINALDSRTAVDFWAGLREVDVDYVAIKDGSNEDRLEDFYGQASGPADGGPSQKGMTLEFTSAVDSNTITATLTGSFPNTYDESNFGNPREAIEENLTRWVEGITVDAENDTSTAP